LIDSIQLLFVPYSLTYLWHAKYKILQQDAKISWIKHHPNQCSVLWNVTKLLLHICKQHVVQQTSYPLPRTIVLCVLYVYSVYNKTRPVCRKKSFSFLFRGKMSLPQQVMIISLRVYTHVQQHYTCQIRSRQ